MEAQLKSFYFFPLPKTLGTLKFPAESKQPLRRRDLQRCHCFSFRCSCHFQINHLRAYERNHLVTFQPLPFEDAAFLLCLSPATCAQRAARQSVSQQCKSSVLSVKVRREVTGSALAVKADRAPRVPNGLIRPSTAPLRLDASLPLFEASLQRTSSHCI